MDLRQFSLPATIYFLLFAYFLRNVQGNFLPSFGVFFCEDMAKNLKKILYISLFHSFQPRDYRNREVLNFGKSWRIKMKLGGKLSDFGSLKQKLKNKFLNREIPRIIYLKKFCPSRRLFLPLDGKSGVETRIRKSPDQIGRVGRYVIYACFVIIGRGLDLSGEVERGTHILSSPH